MKLYFITLKIHVKKQSKESGQLKRTKRILNKQYALMFIIKLSSNDFYDVYAYISNKFNVISCMMICITCHTLSPNYVLHFRY